LQRLIKKPVGSFRSADEPLMGRDGVKCEAATGSLAIVASDHGPSHPCGLTQRIAIASGVLRRSRKSVCCARS
jgi:hypothetical protein